MNLAQLIEELQNLIETGECSGEELVLFAHQPRYPLQCAIDGPNVTEEEEGPFEGMKTVYLCEGLYRERWPDGTEVSPYAPREAWGEGV